MRSTFLFFYLLILILGAFQLQSSAQTVSWSQLKGPYGGSVQSLTVDQAGDVFATSFDGKVEIYASTDRGGNWERVYSLLSYGYQPVLAADSSGNVYYGDMSSGLIKSTDRGISWSKIGLSGGVSAVSLISGNRLCAGGSRTLSVSDDAGTTWSVYQVRPDAGDVSSIVEDSLGDIYAGFYRVFGRFPSGGGIFYSSDGGKTWQLSGMLLDSIISITVERNGRVFALASDGVNTSIYSAAPRDTTWTQDAAGIPYAANIAAMQTDETGETVAITDAGIFVYDDSRSEWEPGSSATISSATITKVFYDSKRISYAGTAFDGVYFLKDTSSTWLQCGMSPTTVTSLGVDQTGKLIVGTRDGIFVPGPSTGTWQRLSSGLGRGAVHDIRYSSFSGRLYVSTDNGFYFLQNDGNRWASLTNQPTYSFGETSWGKLYIGTSGGVLVSYNNGGYWESSQTIGLPITNIYSLVVDSSGYVFAGAAYAGVFESTDGGTFWSQTGINSPLIFYSVKALATDDHGTMYAGTDTAGAFYSSDGGNSWQKISSITGKSVTDFTVSRDSEYFTATADEGVFVSTDRGQNWWPANTGLADLNVASIALDKSGNVYAGTDSGVYESAGVVTSVRENDGLPERYSLSQNYPNPFNPSTAISYRLSAVSRVNLVVYDILGRNVATLVSGVQSAGNHQAIFNGSEFPSGVYFYRLTAGNFSETRKMVLIK